MNKLLKTGGIALLALLALAAGFLITSGGPNDLARQALEAYQAGELETARVTYEHALAQDPNHAASVIGLAEVAIDEQDPDRIRRYGERAIEACSEAPRRGKLRLALARTRVDDDQYAEAWSLAELAATDDPGLAGEAQGVQGLAKLGEGDAAAARTLLEAAAQAGSRDPRVHSALTQLQLGAGQLAEAHASAERAVELAPQDPALWVIVADLRERRGDGPGARAGLERAVALEPANVSARAGLVRFQLDAGDAPAALATAQAAHDAAPDDPVARRALARALVASGQAQAALDLLPAEGLGWQEQLVRGEALLAAGQQEAGQQAIAAAAASRPHDLATQLEAGRVALAAGQPASAFFRTALELGGSYEARVGLAGALAAEDRAANHAAIVDQLERARQEAPARVEAFAALAEHLIAVGSPDGARALLADLSLEDPRILFWRGRAALAAEAWDEAREALQACQAQGGVPGLEPWLQRARERR